MSTKPDISILDWINYNPNVGTLGLYHFGLPGSGKSNLSSGLFQMCMKRGEFLIMPGDRFCEWRHFPSHSKFPTQLQILVPQGIDIYYHNFCKNGWFTDVDYRDLDIFNYINNKKRMLVIYDQHLELSTRINFWKDIFEQLLNRKEYVDIPFGLFFHEAGIYFDEFAEGEQWKAIKDFAANFVEHRKALIRPMFLAQLESEVKSTIRKKCPFHIIRKSFLSKMYSPRLRRAAPFTPIHKYHLCYGGIYIKDNETTKFDENKKIFKMIPPRVSFIENGFDNNRSKRKKKMPFGKEKCGKCGYIWQKRAKNPKMCPNCKNRHYFTQETIKTEQNS